MIHLDKHLEGAYTAHLFQLPLNKIDKIRFVSEQIFGMPLKILITPSDLKYLGLLGRRTRIGVPYDMAYPYL